MSQFEQLPHPFQYGGPGIAVELRESLRIADQCSGCGVAVEDFTGGKK